MKSIRLFMSILVVIILAACASQATPTSTISETVTIEPSHTITPKPTGTSPKPTISLPPPTPLPSATPIDCTQGWTQLKIDIFAKVTGTDSDLPNRVRSEPIKGNNTVAQIYPGAIVKVVEGPVCIDDLVFWKVENAVIPGGVGWSAEGDGSEYWLEPYTYLANDMISIPAGEFLMGCDPVHNGGFSCEQNELPLHTVYLDKFFINKYEVTHAQYTRCVEAGACAEPVGSYYIYPTYDSYPEIYISWYDARDYCAWVGNRLPSEAEWEKAARGTTIRAYPWGDQFPDCTLANHYNTIGPTWFFCFGETTQVGSYSAGASQYGVLDMTGNVHEWVNDWYQEDYYNSSPYKNPQGPTNGDYKVLRGGGWFNGGTGLRVVFRSLYPPETRYDFIGFRCATGNLP